MTMSDAPIQHSSVSTYRLLSARLPVLVSVPHAGRQLPDWIASEARVPLSDLARLSDGWSDMIAAPLFAAGACVVKANLLRAVADCNRHEADMDGIDVVPG
ncbi:MAG: N-formylglutamate amidohydrolase [Sphingopyxis sp.]|nr:N-formylglutamate amidohydrolase [Sphingopyxis sp.]